MRLGRRRQAQGRRAPALRHLRPDTPNNQLARQLGCSLDDDGFVVDRMGATTIAGVHAIGDLRRRGRHQITLSAADGMMAAIAIAFRSAEARLSGTVDTGTGFKRHRGE